MKRYQCDAGEFGFDEIINGQTPLLYNDLLTQVGTQRSLREDAILCYEHTGIEGLLAQIQDMLGGDTDNRTVTSSPYFWPEYCEDVTIITTIKKANAVGAAGQPISNLAIDASSMSQNGRFSVPRKGFRAYIVELDGKPANITDVVKSPVGGHSLQLTPINGDFLDLTQFDTYTLLVDPLRNYVKGTTDEIQTGGFVKNPPTIRKGYVQMFETGIEIHQDELNNYVYDVDFRIGKGLGPDQKQIEYYDFPLINSELLERYMDSKIINTLFNVRDDQKQQGFDGFIPSVQAQGMFNRYYDPGSGVSLKSIIFNWIRQLRARNGAKQNMIFHDFGFKLDWSDSLAQLVKDSGQGKVYQLFGQGGEGVRNFTYYDFQDIHAYGYDFKTMNVDTFDNFRYGAPLKDFALVMPVASYRDTKGRKVGPVSYVNIRGAEMAPEKKMWVNDQRPRGLRTVKFYCQDTWGMEIHCVSKMGIMRKARC